MAHSGFRTDPGAGEALGSGRRHGLRRPVRVPANGSGSGDRFALRRPEAGSYRRPGSPACASASVAGPRRRHRSHRPTAIVIFIGGVHPFSKPAALSNAWKNRASELRAAGASPRTTPDDAAPAGRVTAREVVASSAPRCLLGLFLLDECVDVSVARLVVAAARRSRQVGSELDGTHAQHPAARYPRTCRSRIHLRKVPGATDTQSVASRALR